MSSKLPRVFSTLNVSTPALQGQQVGPNIIIIRCPKMQTTLLLCTHKHPHHESWPPGLPAGLAERSPLSLLPQPLTLRCMQTPSRHPTIWFTKTTAAAAW